MPLDHLWSAWRSGYIDRAVQARFGPEPDGSGGESSLFEAILASDDDREAGVVMRGDRCFVLLNRYPYTAGATMVLPNRAVPDLDQLDESEFAELWHLVRLCVAATRAAFSPDGCNVGINLGAAAGGSLSEHLHVHVVPRWVGDANFMTSVAETRTLPIALSEAWDRLRAAWPA